MIICSARLSGRRPLSRSVGSVAVIRERMRLSRRSFDRGLAGDFRRTREGGARRLLPLV